MFSFSLFRSFVSLFVSLIEFTWWSYQFTSLTHDKWKFLLSELLTDVWIDPHKVVTFTFRSVQQFRMIFECFYAIGFVKIHSKFTTTMMRSHLMWVRDIHNLIPYAARMGEFLSKCPSSPNRFDSLFVSHSLDFNCALLLFSLSLSLCCRCLFRFHHVEMCLHIVWTTNKMIVLWWVDKLNLFYCFRFNNILPRDWIYSQNFNSCRRCMCLTVCAREFT